MAVHDVDFFSSTQLRLRLMVLCWLKPEALRYDTLKWVIRRKDAFQFLLADTNFATDSKEMSQHELDMISAIAQADLLEGKKFWATAFAVQVLSDWGVSVSVWSHECACVHHTSDKEKSDCPLKGRRAIQLACGQWKKFLRDLNASALSHHALAEISKLESQEPSDGEFAKCILEDFQNCKAHMQFKASQSWAFWGGLPFSVLEMCQHWVDPSADENASRRKAKELQNTYDQTDSKAALGIVPFHFFGNELNRQRMDFWMRGGPLHEELKNLLLGYSTALTVMQRLESRHHFVNLALSRGRALSVPAVMSNLRRRFNHDLTHQSFRDELPMLLNQFHKLVVGEWTSRAALLEEVYGHGLEQMHPNITFEQQQVALHAAMTAGEPETAAVPAKLAPGHHYSVYLRLD